MVTASVVPITATAIPITCASAPDATPTAALLSPPIDAFTHSVLVPSGLWPDAAMVLDAASVLVTAAADPTLAATFDSNAATRSGAIPAASIVAADGASVAPVHRAALHRGQLHSRAACAQPPP